MSALGDPVCLTLDRQRREHVVTSRCRSVAKLLRHAGRFLVDGLLYMGNEQGIITCVDAESGEVYYQKRLGGLFMSSPVAADGKIYFFAEDGDCHVLKPGKEFESLATNKIPGGFMASPAIAGKNLILRTKDAVWCIGD